MDENEISEFLKLINFMLVVLFNWSCLFIEWSNLYFKIY